MSDNNAIYRYLRTAYRLDSYRLIEIWKKAGVEMSNYQVKSYYLSEDNKGFKLLSGNQLKKWLVALMQDQGIDVPGVNIRLMLDAFLQHEGLSTTGDLVKDAILIKDHKRGSEFN